jgi:hypothetical protein
MTKREFSDAFRTFVNKYITSVEQIEVLLTLRGDEQRSWSVSEISSMLRSNPASIESRLEGLCRAKFAAGDVERGYRYLCSGPLRVMVDELDQAYRSRRFSVIELVFSRSSAAKSFADAFRLREEDDEDLR